MKIRVTYSQKTGTQLRTAIAKTEQVLRQNERDLETIKLAGEIPVEEELVAAREQCNTGWRLIKITWLEEHMKGGDQRVFRRTTASCRDGKSGGASGIAIVILCGKRVEIVGDPLPVTGKTKAAPGRFKES